VRSPRVELFQKGTGASGAMIEGEGEKGDREKKGISPIIASRAETEAELARVRTSV
jgi:hypothetical protein